MRPQHNTRLGFVDETAEIAEPLARDEFERVVDLAHRPSSQPPCTTIPSRSTKHGSEAGPSNLGISSRWRSDDEEDPPLVEHDP